MISASAPAGMFSMKDATQYLMMTAAQKDQLTFCFIKKMLIKTKLSRKRKPKLQHKEITRSSKLGSHQLSKRAGRLY